MLLAGNLVACAEARAASRRVLGSAASLIQGAPSRAPPVRLSWPGPPRRALPAPVGQGSKLQAAWIRVDQLRLWSAAVPLLPGGATATVPRPPLPPAPPVPVAMLTFAVAIVDPYP